MFMTDCHQLYCLVILSHIKKAAGFYPRRFFWFLQYNYFSDVAQPFSGHFQQVYTRGKFPSGINFIKAGGFI